VAHEGQIFDTWEEGLLSHKQQGLQPLICGQAWHGCRGGMGRYPYPEGGVNRTKAVRVCLTLTPLPRSSSRGNRAEGFERSF